MKIIKVDHNKDDNGGVVTIECFNNVVLDYVIHESGEIDIEPLETWNTLSDEQKDEFDEFVMNEQSIKDEFPSDDFE